MVQRSYPFTKNPDGTDGKTTDAEFARMFGLIFPSGVDGFYKSTALQVTADSSGLKVAVNAGDALVDGHFYTSDEPEPIDIDPNSETANRIDTIVLHKEYEPVNSVLLRIVKGTPGAGAPTLTQERRGTFQYPLGNVTIRPGDVTIAPSQVTDRRTWWGIEFMRRMGIVIGPTADPATTILHVKTA